MCLAIRSIILHCMAWTILSISVSCSIEQTSSHLTGNYSRFFINAYRPRVIGTCWPLWINKPSSKTAKFSDKGSRIRCAIRSQQRKAHQFSWGRRKVKPVCWWSRYVERGGKTRSFRENKKLYYVLGFPSFIMPAIAAHNSARNK